MTKYDKIVEVLRLPLSRGFGFVLAALILFSSSRWTDRQPLVGAVILFLGCLLAGGAFLGRMWCSLYIAGYKNDRLVTTGPYSLCRNPLYFFSMLGGMGVGMATETLTIPLCTAAAFGLYYPHVIKSEEGRLRELHGAAYEEYLRSVPVFFPRFSGLREPDDYVVAPKIFRNHLFDAVWFVWLLGLFQVLVALHVAGVLPTWITLF